MFCHLKWHTSSIQDSTNVNRLNLLNIINMLNKHPFVVQNITIDKLIVFAKAENKG